MIPFSPPHITQEIIDEVVDTLQSGWITTGPKTKLFEQRICEYCGNPATLAVNSSTSGMKLILSWFGIGPGDEVIIPAYTYCATANVVIQSGATPVMVDISEEDFNISVKNIRSAITKKTKAIIPVDIAGYPCDYDAINALVREVEIVKLFDPKNKNQFKLGRILVLSDSAHSIGAKKQDKMAGCLTDISVFSFHAVKNITTAEGGAICLNLPEPFCNQEIYKYLNILTLHGQTLCALEKTKGGCWEYDVIEPGFKCNMTDIHASIGLVQLSHYKDELLQKRKKIFEYYNQRLTGYTWAQLPLYESNNISSSFHVYTLRINNISENDRNRIIQVIKDKGVCVNVHFKPLPMLTAYKKLGYNIDDYPISYKNYESEISLPVYADLSKNDLQTIVDVLIESLEEHFISVNES